MPFSTALQSFLRLDRPEETQVPAFYSVKTCSNRNYRQRPYRLKMPLNGGCTLAFVQIIFIEKIN